VLQKFRGHILDVAEERCDKPIPYQDRTDEIGEMSRAFQTLQNVAMERQIQAWVKAEIAVTTSRLQSSEDFHDLFGKPFVADLGIGRTAVRRLLSGRGRTYAHVHPGGRLRPRPIPGTARFALGEGLVGQAAAERRTLTVASTAEHVRSPVSAGMATVTPSTFCTSIPWSRMAPW
jgi:hypothetical protein